MKLHNQATLILFCGLPGSGKTTLVKRLEQTGKGFDLPFDEIWRRLERRNGNLASGTLPITRQQLERYRKIFQPPDEHELRLLDAYTIYT